MKNNTDIEIIEVTEPQQIAMLYRCGAFAVPRMGMDIDTVGKFFGWIGLITTVYRRRAYSVRWEILDGYCRPGHGGAFRPGLGILCITAEDVLLNPLEGRMAEVGGMRFDDIASSAL